VTKTFHGKSIDVERRGRHQRDAERQVGLLLDPVRKILEAEFVCSEAAFDELTPTTISLRVGEPAVAVFVPGDIVHVLGRQVHPTAKYDDRGRLDLGLIQFESILHCLPDAGPRHRRGGDHVVRGLDVQELGADRSTERRRSIFSLGITEPSSRLARWKTLASFTRSITVIFSRVVGAAPSRRPPGIAVR
jgi:hypothetical protein